MLKLMYITNDPQTAQIAQRAGVDRILWTWRRWARSSARAA